jgi:hypothetical protein
MKKTEFILLGIFALGGAFMWSWFDNNQYLNVFGIDRSQASVDTVTLNASVAAGAVTLTLGSGSTVQFGTLTAGTERHSQSSLSVNANDTINVSFGRDRANPATTLASTADTSINISDTAGGLDVFDGLGACTATETWAAGSSTGLGFTLVVDDDSSKDTACWGSGTTKTDTNNKYAALQASASASTAWTTTSTASTIYASFGWIIDVPTSQQATSYTGDVIVSATVTP